MTMRTLQLLVAALLLACQAPALAEIVRGLDCTSAASTQTDIVIDGDNTGAPNGADYYSCPYWPMSGGEDIYELTVPETALHHIRLTSSGCDLGMFLLAECDASAACLGFSEDIVDGVSSITIDLDPGLYYIVIDGYMFAGCPYELAISAGSHLPGTDRCDDEGLVCLEPTSIPRLIKGNNYASEGYGPDYYIDGGACLPLGHNDLYTEDNDVVYVLAMNDGDQMEAMIPEGLWSIYLTDDCSADNCIVGDGPHHDPPYTISYTHSGGYALLYLVVGGFYDHPDDEFLLVYTHTGDCGHPIGNEAATWGEVKSMYR